MTPLTIRPLSTAELLHIASIPQGERARIFGMYWPVPHPNLRLQLNVEHYTAEDGTVHVAFAFPWPGRPGYVICWRGVVCAVCNGARVEANPPWACPVVECTCAK